MEELNVDGSENSRDKFNALMEDLQTKTDNFMNVICATKTLGKIRVKPISAVAYEKLDAFIASIDDVIKWYESDNSEMKEKIDFLSAKVKDVLKESDARMEETEKIIAEQNEKITKIEETSSKMIFDYDENFKALEEKIEAMKDSENKMQEKCKEFEQKETASKKLIEEMEIKINTEMFKLGALTINLKEANDDIHYWKQKFEQVNLHAGNTEMNNRLAELEAELQLKTAKNADDARQHEADKITKIEETSSKMISDYDEKIIALEEKIETMKDSENKMEQKCKEFEQKETASNKIIEEMEIKINTEMFKVGALTINLKEANDDVLSVNNLESSNVFGCCYCYDQDICRKETATNLLKLPTFANLQLFYLIRCPYEFDLETFGKFMKVCLVLILYTNI
uniref:Uncharacterized protein n=1 Tax=Panagrolaimus sp. ES5 TaxID=591445 RepID=A0AC34FK25_9BILA